MAYTPTAWSEAGMSTVAKVAGLNNLETQYDEALAYLATLTHSSRYYTKAECDAKYFQASNDGADSGLICETLDGYTAQGIIDAGTPAGNIGWWTGTADGIPAGWYLCDGTYGTPNLKDKFVVGAGNHYLKGETGGLNTVTTSAAITIAGHALTEAETPKHTHGTITDHFPITPWSSMGYVGNQSFCINYNTDVARNTEYAGTGAAHDHLATFAGTQNQVKMPPYYALCYIMNGGS